MKPTVSLCVFSHNDLPMLKATLLHEIKWVDQICLLDMASDDGTSEFAHAFLRPGIDVYVRRDKNTCAELGFAEAKNAVASMASCDWILINGADTVMDWKQSHNIKDVLARANGDILSIDTVNVKPYKDVLPHQIELAAVYGDIQSVEKHRVFVRRSSGIKSRGYIHEEPYRGEVNCHKEAEDTVLRRYHFHGWGNDELRQLRYSWMIYNAIKNPELQRYTNRWWYDVYYNQNKALIHERAVEYELYVERTGKR